MVSFIKIVNGPPCRVNKKSSNNNLSHSYTHNKPETNIVDWVCDIIQAQDMVTSIAELKQIWQHDFQKIGVCMLSYYQVYDDDVNQCHHYTLGFQYGLPQIWNTTYNRKGYFEKHPLISIILEKNIPLRRDDILKHLPKNTRDAQYLKSLHDLNISDGIAFPVFSFGQRYGLFVLGFKPTHPGVSGVQIELLQYCVQKAHNRYLALMT